MPILFNSKLWVAVKKSFLHNALQVRGATEAAPTLL
jgi:hypothetical protein